MKLIILSITNYKEKDGIVTGLSENELVTFNVRGILDPKSKNHILNTPLIEADIEFIESNHKHKTVKSSSIIFSPYGAFDSLEKLGVISLVEEATNKLLQEEERILIYPSLKSCLKGLKDSKTNPIQIAIRYLLDILTISGNELEFNRCVYCGNKEDIVAFSFSDGGFVCRECYDQNIIPSMNVSQMKLFRYIYLNKDYLRPIENFNQMDAIEILKQLIVYIYDFLGIKLKSVSLLS